MPSLRNGEDVGNQIREKSNGLIWMQDPMDYRGMKQKQAFVDNSFGEEVVFFNCPGNVLLQGQGSPKYRYRHTAESNRIYTREKIKEIIASCEELSEFKEYHSSAYIAARKESDFAELIAGLFRKGDRKHRYVYRITDDVSVYYGLTYNPSRRKWQYINESHNEIASQILKNGGRFEIITGMLTADKAREKEIALISCPETSIISGVRLLCVNMVKGGSLGGTELIWNKEKVAERAMSYMHRVDFQKGHAVAYVTARRNGWLDEVCAHMKPLRHTWNLEEARDLAKKCSSRSEFQKRFPNAESSARKYGWLGTICSHMPVRSGNQYIPVYGS